MHITQKDTLQMLRRVTELVAGEPVDPRVAVPAAELGGIVARLQQHAINQDTHLARMRSLTVEIVQKAGELREDLMRPVVLAARTVGLREGRGRDSDGASVLEAIRLPKGRRDYQQLIVTANRMATTMEEHAERLQAAGIAREHAAQLRASADALVTAIGARDGQVQLRLAATRGVREEAIRGRAVVRLLWALVRPGVRGDVVRRGEWEKAVRVVRRYGGGGALGEGVKAA